MDILNDNPEILWCVALAFLVLTIAMIAAVFKLFSIARYQRSTLKLTALMARKQGISSEIIHTILNDADQSLMAENGAQMEKEIQKP